MQSGFRREGEKKAAEARAVSHVESTGLSLNSGVLSNRLAVTARSYLRTRKRCSEQICIHGAPGRVDRKAVVKQLP